MKALSALRQFGDASASVDLYEDRGCGTPGTAWPRIGSPGPEFQYLGTLVLDTEPPALSVDVVKQVHGSVPPPPPDASEGTEHRLPYPIMILHYFKLSTHKAI